MNGGPVDESGMTFKQRKWLKRYVVDGNATRAALEAYDLDENDEGQYATASVIGYQNIRKLKIDDLMDEMGLTDEYLMNCLKENTKSMKPYGKTGELHPDTQGRNKAVELSLKVKKKLIDKVEIQGGFLATSKMVVEVVDDREKNQVEPEANPGPPVTE